MIINKVLPFWKEEDLQRLAEIRREQEVLSATIPRRDNRLQFDRKNWEKLEEWSNLEDQARELQAEVENRYKKASTKKTLLADVEEIVKAITREDFLEFVGHQIEVLASRQRKAENEAMNSTIDLIVKEHGYGTECYENCTYFILLNLRVQLEALGNFPDEEDSLDRVTAIVEKRVSLWYVNPKPSHFPIPYSKPTDAIAYMTQRSAIIDAISGDATIDRSSVHMRIANFKDLKATIGISTDKLLSTALAVFARTNDFSQRAKEAKHRRVVISLKAYAQFLGYDVVERETSTPEEAEKEKKRIKANLDNARKKIQKDLNILYNLSFEWEERINGKVESFSSVRLLSAKEYSAGNISLTFTPEIADYLVSRGLITQYNTALLGIDERHPNAYYIMRKLEEQYNMDSNRARGTHDRISIPALLAVTDLASYEEVQKKDRGHWQERIKEPLEENLDYLTQEGFLRSWEYVHEKGRPLTDEEAGAITSYKDFAELYLLFDPAQKVDHTERIEAKKEAISEAKKKTTTKKKS